MTDELAAIKQREAKRRREKPWVSDHDGRLEERRDCLHCEAAVTYGPMLDEYRADLDRTIEIAESFKQLVDFANTYGLEDYLNVRNERDQARADVLKLRDTILNCPTCGQRFGVNHVQKGHKDFYVCSSCGIDIEDQVVLLADTEHYEQYR